MISRVHTDIKHCLPGLAKTKLQGSPGLKNTFSRPVSVRSPAGNFEI